jgi:hypothetical protein
MADLEQVSAEKPYITPESSSLEAELPSNLQNIAHHGFFGTLRHYETILDRKFGVEAHGPARILPEERNPVYNKWSNQAVMALMWASGTMNLSCFATGFLGWELGLDLSQTIGITFCASLVGAAVTVSTHVFPLGNAKCCFLVTDMSRVGVQQWDQELASGKFQSAATPLVGGHQKSLRSSMLLSRLDGHL